MKAEKNKLCNDTQYNAHYFQITPEIYGLKIRGGGGVHTLTWYTYMCLPFRVYFCENRYIDGWVQVALKGIGILMDGEIAPK